MNALIIGAAGFVGGYLIDHLLELRGWSVDATKLPGERIARKGISVHDLNILDQAAVCALLKQVGPDCIFHLAAQSSVALSWKNPQATIDINITGAVNVLEAARHLEIPPRILLIGSGEEYGHIRPEEMPVSETCRLRPGNIYAATKAAQGMLGRIYFEAYRLPVIMVRAFNHIGPGQDSQFVVASFCRQIAEAEARLRPPLLETGNLSAKRDFTDVKDVVRAYSLLAERGTPGDIYNVGSGVAIEIECLLMELLSMARVKIEVRLAPDRMRPVDLPVVVADIGKLRHDTGWTPQITLSQTLSETLQYWRRSVDIH